MPLRLMSVADEMQHTMLADLSGYETFIFGCMPHSLASAAADDGAFANVETTVMNLARVSDSHVSHFCLDE